MNEGLEKVIQMTRAQVNRLKPCALCVYANESCTYCSENDIIIQSPKQYGCRKHTTKEELIRKVAKQEWDAYVAKTARRFLEMDIMGYMIAGASQTMEKLDAEMNAEYNSVKDRDPETELDHKQRRANRQRLLKSYSELKDLARKYRREYDKNVELYFSTLFTEEDGTYDYKESDKNLRNAGTINKFVRVFVDKALDNSENANAIMAFMESLPGSGIFEGQNSDKYLIK